MIIRSIGIFVAFLLFAIGGYLIGFNQNWFGSVLDAGEIAGQAVPDDVILARRDAQQAAYTQVGGTGETQILFGDLHVHSSFSLDAYLITLPYLSGTGLHPVAEACDFARYCSGIDFFAITDHAEGLTPTMWQQTQDTIRECQALAGDQANPDLVAFMGFEWSQAGGTPDTHYGHRNVIFEGLEPEGISARPIAATINDRDARTLVEGAPPGIILAAPGSVGAFVDLNAVLEAARVVPSCDPDLPSSELPADCYELTSRPGDLVERLFDQGLDPLIIPHGTSWGLFAPPGVTFDKQLEADMHPEAFPLFEINSGHGTSEQYFTWLAIDHDAEGNVVCPAPQDGYVPGCWRAGEIIMDRCLEAGDDVESCAVHAANARTEYLNYGVGGRLVVPGAETADWLDSGQCPDCFLPPMDYRPGTSAQYGLAIGNFDDGAPRRFTWGFIGSSDNHRAQPGTGFSEEERIFATDSVHVISEFWRRRLIGDPEPVSPYPSTLRAEEVQALGLFVLRDVERQGSFWFTGGLAAVHSEGRSRSEIWSALQRRETFATSGPRILLWFDMVGGANGLSYPMGAQVTTGSIPRFRVRAVGDFVQQEGCPDFTSHGLDAERITELCHDDCYNPGDERHPIVRIEIIRIRPQITEGEDVASLIEDPFLVHECSGDPAGCTFEFEDPSYVEGGRDTLYYARVIQEATPTINGAQLRCTYDEDGNCIAVDPCYTDFRTPMDESCLAPVEHRAWASPIYLTYVADVVDE